MKKHLLLLVICTACFGAARAQKDTTKITVYAGLVGSGFIHLDTGKLTPWVNLRVGVRMKEPLTKHLSFDGWLGYDPGYDVVLFRASVKRVWKNGGVSFGYQPTPVSEIRPYPFSVDGQFQFTAEALPPGGTLGSSVWYKSMKAGFYIRSGSPEYHLTYTKGVFSAGAWTSAKTFGGVTAKIETDPVYAMATMTGDNRQALALSVTPIQKLKWCLAWNFSLRKGNIADNFVGILHNIETTWFTAARFGFGWDIKNHTAGAFFLISMNYKR